ncbi:hypothetical protein H0H93_004993 [Arthromyces matolae]|nr:hypothetical protein H0H93_004993 [Arthromyces matolae]
MDDNLNTYLFKIEIYIRGSDSGAWRIRMGESLTSPARMTRTRSATAANTGAARNQTVAKKPGKKKGENVPPPTQPDVNLDETRPNVTRKGKKKVPAEPNPIGESIWTISRRYSHHALALVLYLERKGAPLQTLSLRTMTSFCLHVAGDSRQRRREQ